MSVTVGCTSATRSSRWPPPVRRRLIDLFGLSFATASRSATAVNRLDGAEQR
jgi:hypothetical protein